MKIARSRSSPHRRFALRVSLIAAVLVPILVSAAESIYSFNQSPMDLQHGLNRIAATMQTPILFDPKLTEGKQCPALSGAYSRVQVLSKALEGTGLAYRLTDTSVILVFRPDESASTSVAHAATSRVRPAGANELLQTVVVMGIRNSIQGSTERSRASPNLLDAVIATDIGKLPDDNAAEALQRIGGVQISRDQGEGAGVAIRGLGQINSEIEGRSIFTASSGRILSFEDFPAELLAGIDVYKTPSANQIEGGLSGTVDLRLHQPFDFDGRRIAGQINSTYYDNAGAARPQGSLLMSDRWPTEWGEIGLLISGSYQASAFRSDYDVVGAPRIRTDLVDLSGNEAVGDVGDAVVAPLGGGIAEQSGTRLRQGLDAHFQWRPNDDLEINLDAFKNRFDIKTDATLLFATASAGVDYRGTAVQVVPGTHVFQSGTWHDLFLDSNSFHSERLSDISQFGLGSRWARGPWSVSGDLSSSVGHSYKTFYQLALSSALANATTGARYGAAPEVYQNTATPLPIIQFAGLDMTDPSQMVFDRAIQSVDRVRGREIAARLDARYGLGGRIFDSIAAGLRYSERSNSEASVYQYNALGGIGVSELGNLIEQAQLSLFRRGDGNEIQQAFLTAAPATVRNFDLVRAAFDLPEPSFTNASLSTYLIRERVFAGYLMTSIEKSLGAMPLTGNIGVRATGTAVDTNGSVADPSGNRTPLNLQKGYVDVLPQANLKLDIDANTIARFAAYRTLTRQDFGNLAPQLTLDFLFHTGSRGNPALQPLLADNLDVGIERHDPQHNSAFLNLFFKRVTGFIQNEVAEEEYFGQAFDVTRPQNGGTGRLWGAEIGVTRFLTGLPVPLDGLGLQTNYTLVHSVAPSPISTQQLPLEGLSKHSYNLIAFYERGPLSARVAFNYRSSYLITSVANGTTGFASDWSAPQAIVDASLSFSLTTHIKLSADGANLSNLRSRTYYTGPSGKHNTTETDRRFTVGIRFSY